MQKLPQIRRAVTSLICFTLLFGCASAPRLKESLPRIEFQNDVLFGARPNFLTPAELHSLSPIQAKDFLDYYSAEVHASVAGHQRLADYLTLRTSSFQHRSGTNSATDSLRLMAGNCLSLAILTTALAELVDVRLSYQLMDDVPVFSLEGSAAVKGVHIRTKLYHPQGANDLLTFGAITVDYFPSGRERFVSNLATEKYYARYYLNLAASAITQSDNNLAYWLSLEALKYDPLSSGAFNNLAIVHRRVGAIDKSEEIYQYALQHLADNRITLLRNYQGLLVSLRRHTEAEKLQNEIDHWGGYSPLDFYHLAIKAYDNSDYLSAISNFKKSLVLAPYLHESNFGLAKSYLQIGELAQSKRYLMAARSEAGKRADRLRYTAKLAALDKL